jgi:hypothetical protein
MKRLCLFITAVLLSFSGFAQTEKGHVYLKNGTILKGKYQYTEEASKLRVESAGNIWVFDASEVDSVVSVRAKKVKEPQLPSVTSYFFRTELGILAGNAENSQSAPLSVTGSVNYSILPKVSLGLGTGVEFFKESYLPVFLNAEYKMRNSYSTPYFFLKAGYEVAIDESRTLYYDVYPSWSSIWPGPNYSQDNLDAKGGVMVNPGMGYMYLFSPGFGMSVAFGYQFHRLHYTGSKDYGLDIDYNRLTIKVGIIFK